MYIYVWRSVVQCLVASSDCCLHHYSCRHYCRLAFVSVRPPLYTILNNNVRNDTNKGVFTLRCGFCNPHLPHLTHCKFGGPTPYSRALQWRYTFHMHQLETITLLFVFIFLQYKDQHFFKKGYVQLLNCRFFKLSVLNELQRVIPSLGIAQF